MVLNLQASPGTTRKSLGTVQRMALPECLATSRVCTTHANCAPALQRGFTLMELLVVIALLALLSVGALLSYDGVNEQANEQIARAEMANISKALKQYKRDVGSYPVRQHAADFTFLLADAFWDGASYDVLPEEDKWDIDSARGWRGPYLENTGDGYVEVGAGLGFDGSGSPIAGAVVAEPMRSVADPFTRLPDGVYFVWRPCPTCDPIDAAEKHGRPYYLFDLDQPKKARLVSAGPNGLLEAGVLAAASCADIYDTATGDDIILCLQ